MTKGSIIVPSQACIVVPARAPTRPLTLAASSKVTVLPPSEKPSISAQVTSRVASGSRRRRALSRSKRQDRGAAAYGEVAAFGEIARSTVEISPWFWNVSRFTKDVVCFARAANTEEIKVRELELNSATKLALASAALCKTLDHHRGPDWPEYIDDTVPRRRRLATADISKGAQPDPKNDGDKGNGEKHNGDTKPKDCLLYT